MVKPSKPNRIISEIKKVIRHHYLHDWITECPWLTGSLGNLKAPVWFLGEYPSRAAVDKVDKKARADDIELTADLQWSCLDDSANLWREAVTEAGLKVGNSCDNSGWNCYITNIIKEPQIPRVLNTRPISKIKEEAELWRSVLQLELCLGAPKVLVVMGERANKVLEHLKKNGLQCPPTVKIPSYAYIITKPDNKLKLGPRHLARIENYKLRIAYIAALHSCECKCLMSNVVS